ncbi:hypothetical protein F4776DRAFT_664565 [Hypoxylon sp. NC0597]|nr:hypothetical protein F4776DRAFT_664565 [Hypoxylon sp. NC0597]
MAQHGVPQPPRAGTERAVGRTPEEHAALEHMLARRRIFNTRNHHQIQKQQHQQHAEPRRTPQDPSSTSIAAAAAIIATAWSKNPTSKHRDAPYEIKHERETAVRRSGDRIRIPELLPSVPRYSMIDDSSYYSLDDLSSDSSSDDSDCRSDYTYLEPPG